VFGFRRHLKILFLALCAVALSTAWAPSSGEDWAGLRDQARESILYIRAVTRNLDGTNAKVADAATGFIVTPRGHVITVAHIIQPAKEDGEIDYFASLSPNDSRRFRLTLITSDKNLDIALFQLPPAAHKQSWMPLVFAPSGNLPDDANLLVMGFPLSQELSSTNGMLSNRFGPNGRFQTNIPLNHGNSGGPVFDISGRVIGVACGGIPLAAGITYVIPSDFLRPTLSLAGVEIRSVDDAVDLLALVNRGYAYLGKQEWDLAIKDFNQAIRVDPKYALALKNRGAAYLGKRDWDLAIKDYNQAIHLEPNYAEHYYNRGAAYLGRGDYNRAIEDFNEAIRLNFDDKALVLYWRGYAKRQVGDQIEGQADIAAARAINQNVGR
jgi:tetratricopeptide (TPR) repeat protein